jgi:hypothetical protein
MARRYPPYAVFRAACREQQELVAEVTDAFAAFCAELVDDVLVPVGNVA